MTILVGFSVRNLNAPFKQALRAYLSSQALSFEPGHRSLRRMGVRFRRACQFIFSLLSLAIHPPTLPLSTHYSGSLDMFMARQHHLPRRVRTLCRLEDNSISNPPHRFAQYTYITYLGLNGASVLPFRVPVEARMNAFFT